MAAGRTGNRTNYRSYNRQKSGPAGGNFGRYDSYVDGTAVRKPARDPQKEQGHRRRSHHARRIIRNRARKQSLNRVYLVFLAASAIAAAVVCMFYLKLQSDIISHRRSIKDYESKITELSTSNDALEQSLAAYTDLDYIYQKATQELGMVYPDGSHVIYYDKTESEYVYQNEPVPD